MSVKPVRMEEAARNASRRHIVPLSGGKDSTAMSIYLAQAYPDIEFEFVFCDTGAELPNHTNTSIAWNTFLDERSRGSRLLKCSISKPSPAEPLSTWFSMITSTGSFPVRGRAGAPGCSRSIPMRPTSAATRPSPTSRSAPTRIVKAISAAASRCCCPSSRISCPSIPSRTTGSVSPMCNGYSTTAAWDCRDTTSGAAAPVATSASISRSPNGRD